MSSKCLFLTISLIISSLHLFSQGKITLEKIWTGGFRTQYLKEIKHLLNGKEFSFLDYDQNTKSYRIIAESYNSSEKRTLVSSEDIEKSPIVDYNFSDDQNSLLIATDIQYRYRYSTKGKYLYYNLEQRKSIPIDQDWIINPSLSPDASKVAFVKNNNIFIKNLSTNDLTSVTTDGKENHIINGLSDWVYEEEFELIKAYAWSPDGKKIAFLKFDESKVPQYQMPMYSSGSNYPIFHTFKYPKAGEENSTVSAFIYDLEQKTVSNIQFPQTPYYIPKLDWRDANTVVFQTLNRHQNELNIWQTDSHTTKTKLLYQEKDKAYIEINNHLNFIEDKGVYFTSEKSGFNHIYFIDTKGSSTQLTKGNYEVTDIYGFDAKTQSIYYQSNAENEIERNIFSVGLDGKQKQITKSHGIHTASFSSDFSLFVDTFKNSETPTSYNLVNTETSSIIRNLKNNTPLETLLNNTYKLPKKEFKQVSLNGYALNYYIVKPADFNPSKKYPVLLYQYSGPGSQQVKNSWHSYNDYWHYMLTQKGYIIACIDGRGTGGKGANFKKLTQLQLGKLEAEDQISFAKYLGQQSFIDKDRIGIWGWSFGGFTALNAILKNNTVFKAAIAVAPVTNWGFYDTIYTERFLQTPQENPDGYNENSPITHAKNLNCSLLLVHGSADDNVHLQNSLQMSEALVRYNKPFDQEIYTNKNHGIYGGYTRMHLFKKMTDFIFEKL